MHGAIVGVRMDARAAKAGVRRRPTAAPHPRVACSPRVGWRGRVVHAAGCASRPGEGFEQRQATPAFACTSCVGQTAQPHQRVVQLVGSLGVRPGLQAHARDRLGVEPADVAGALRVEPAPAHHRLRAPLFQRCVVEEGVGPRREHFQGQRRRLGQIARQHLHRPGLDALEQGDEAVDVHRLFQTVVDRLAHQRMVGHLALAGEVLGAGELIGKHRGDQIFGLHALQLRRHLVAAAKARQRQRDGGVPAPARDEHRRRQQRLHQHLAHRGGAQVAAHFVEREAVRLGRARARCSPRWRRPATRS